METFDTRAYFAGLLAVARADDRLTDEEVSFLREQAELLDFDVEPLLNNPPTTLNVDFGSTSQITKRMIIRDCIALANVDGSYDAEEKERIRSIAAGAGISSNEVAGIEQWLEDYTNLMKRGESLFVCE